MSWLEDQSLGDLAELYLEAASQYREENKNN
jgi:hypothetical protein